MSALGDQAAEAQRRWNARAQIAGGMRDLILRWHDEAALLDARAGQARASGEDARFQIHAWETRAAALRDCIADLQNLAAKSPAETAVEAVAAERERIRQLAIKHQATYWVGPDDHPAPRRPFALLLQFGDLDEEATS